MRTKAIVFATLLLLFSACTPKSSSVASLPTLAVLPSLTPQPTDTFTPSPTFTPSETWTPSPTYTPSETRTPDIVATRVAEGNATNAAAQETLSALWTSMAPTVTPTATITPSLTITFTLTPTPMPTRTATTEPVTAIRPHLLYARSTANLRTCAERECASVSQLRYGDAVMATGTIDGDEVYAGNRLWYRIDFQGEQVYVYSALVAETLPTVTPRPPTQPPIVIVQPYPTAAISVPGVNPPIAPASGFTCSCSRTCDAMSSCEEAYYQLNTCGCGRRDGDNDGVPCENICPGG